MIILNNYLNTKTYIIGNYIINGCQRFTIDKLDKVCEEFEVSNKVKQETLEAYNLNKANYEDEDWSTLVKDEDYFVRVEVAKQGYGLDILVRDKDYSVRWEVARHSYGLDVLVNDKIYYVRIEAARQLDRLKLMS